MCGTEECCMRGTEECCMRGCCVSVSVVLREWGTQLLPWH